LLTQHFENLAIDEDDRAASLLRMARQVWQNYDDNIQIRRDPLKMEPLEEMRARVLDQLLDPQAGLPQEYRARLRTKLGLPAAPTAPTNAPPPTAPKTSKNQ
jgi:hypothetical protein